MASINNSKALQKFAELMIEKIEQVSGDWKKPWIVNPAGQPQNALTGRAYNGLNDLMLFFFAEKYNYKVPAFLTFNQANDTGARVLKGEKGFPIAYWGRYYVEKDNPNNKITAEQYKKLDLVEKELYKPIPFLQEYTVFNVEQTSIPQDKPELWQKILDKFKTPKLNDENGMFMSADMDYMIKNETWLCPINVKESNRAFYRPSEHSITVPLKAQFENGESYYSTLLHEMAHSTGHQSLLNRDMSGNFGNAEYAKEELVAEMTAALSASSLGISTTIREENAQYLKSWLGSLKEKPTFILSILSDVHKASSLINEVVLQEEINKAEKKEILIDSKVELPTGENITPEETKNLLGLEIGKNYLHGRGQDAREVQLVSVTTGGYFNFKETKSGVKFTLQSYKDKPFRTIFPITPDVDLNIKNEDKLNSKNLFKVTEIPKNELKAIGIKYSDLSAYNTVKLLSGKETKELSAKNPTNGEKINVTLSLQRDKMTGKVTLKINEVQQQSMKFGMKI